MTTAQRSPSRDAIKARDITPRPFQVSPTDRTDHTGSDDDSDAYHPQQGKQVPGLDRDSWLNSKLLKILGLVYGIASPFVVWLIVTIYEQKTDMAVMQQKMANFEEKMLVMKELSIKIDTLNNVVSKMAIDIAIIKAKVNIQ